MRPPFTLKSRHKVLELGTRTSIMGVVNITPDSFYDGGAHFKTEDAIAHGNQLLEEGADILDLGGQSTRPGSEPVGAEEELRRVLPVLKSLRQHNHAWISIDTYRSEVARVCLEEGADMINDVSSFRMDQDLPSIIAQFKAPVVCMHFLKSIHPMPSNPQYTNLKKEIEEFFEETFQIADKSGINRDQMILDAGIGFGKNLEHNLEIIRDLSFLHEFKRPILAGPSRKSFIQKITGLPAESRLEGTAAVAAICLVQGAHILRVHDVRFFRRFCDVFDVLLNNS
jgi:dihydropteroate synthase